MSLAAARKSCCSRFAALIVVGDGNGTIGLGMGKAGEVPEAIRKATAEAKRNMIKIAKLDTSVPHEAIGNYSSSKVIIMPASAGTGVIAGGPVRAVLECAGIKDVRTKSMGSNNKINCVKATFDGLAKMKTAEQIAALREQGIRRKLRTERKRKKVMNCPKIYSIP